MPGQRTLVTALTTPFTPGGELDLASARELYAFAAGTTGQLLVAGTTGEFPALSEGERLLLIELALQEAGADGTIAHVGAPDARGAARLARAAVAAGARRLAALTPYYLPATEDELLDYFSRVREAAGDSELYAYLFPERSGLTVTPEAFGRIAAACGVDGVKLSGAPSGEVAAYRAAAPAGCQVYSGDDRSLTTVLAEGGAGVVSGCSAALPEPFLRLAEAARAGGGAGELASAQELVNRTVALLGPSIGRVKHAQRLRGLPAGASRMTVASPDPRLATEIERLVKEVAA
ncbi:dihydrodipicolinate synthase family protein [Streptomyces sp. 8K308]|uniref:dihydrodipicolinate synthase family protein n=1 Tax=Streptomyces sp. 8K308 TaxID=2530388 RepID=UPI001044C944|nr:dihydrodipicolinate synthase family protein [Streptomyces sp. 8K308]TDC24780.1 dihydrodipicolinate synthase family protein [Streptomyces sp. 8K308]